MRADSCLAGRREGQRSSTDGVAPSEVIMARSIESCNFSDVVDGLDPMHEAAYTWPCRMKLEFFQPPPDLRARAAGAHTR